ncbi:hypothetical protein ACLOJK_005672 [Asimina triloba]
MYQLRPSNLGDIAELKPRLQPESQYCIGVIRFWRLSLPLGASRDHPFANPLGAEEERRRLEQAPLEAMLVVVGTQDLLKDRGEEYAKRLQGWGKKAELLVIEGEEHAFFMHQSWSKAADQLVTAIKRFMAAA